MPRQALRARLLRGALGLDALLAALRRFHWQGAGDWAAALAAGLTRAAAPARPLGALELQALLDEALRVRASACHCIAPLTEAQFSKSDYSLDGWSRPLFTMGMKRQDAASSLTPGCPHNVPSAGLPLLAEARMSH
jgi:hypothetical protein